MQVEAKVVEVLAVVPEILGSPVEDWNLRHVGEDAGRQYV